MFELHLQLDLPQSRVEQLPLSNPAHVAVHCVLPVQHAVAAAEEQRALALSRATVVEKAYAAAVEGRAQRGLGDKEDGWEGLLSAFFW